MFYIERDEFRGNVATITIYDKQSALGSRRSYLRLEHPLYLLERVAIRCPATIACSKTLVVWGIS